MSQGNRAVGITCCRRRNFRRHPRHQSRRPALPSVRSAARVRARRRSGHTPGSRRRTGRTAPQPTSHQYPPPPLPPPPLSPEVLTVGRLSCAFCTPMPGLGAVQAVKTNIQAVTTLTVRRVLSIWRAPSDDVLICQTPWQEANSCPHRFVVGLLRGMCRNGCTISLLPDSHGVAA